MIGAICKRDILAHPFVTIHCFGWRVFFRALVVNHGQTFLALLTETKTLQPPTTEVPDLVGRCVTLELRAKQVYELLANRFARLIPAKEFFETLAREEQEHSELLELCREAACRAVWREEFFTPWRDAVPRLERQMDDVEASLASIDDVFDALRLVIQVEDSEVNKVFRGVVAASGSDFVSKLAAFQTAGEKHVSYICEEIPKLEPDLEPECQELEAAFFVGAA